ncbi:MAG: hypothetical protein DMG14_29310, partial [Acidobacteria bacterium]
MKRILEAFTLIAMAIAMGCSRTEATSDATDAGLRNADRDASNWLMYGRTYDDHRFSPLDQINE